MKPGTPHAILVTIACLGCAAAGPSVEPLTAAGVAGARQPGPATRYRVGDYIVYRYSGAFSTAPVLLREGVRAQQGNRLRIDVTLTRGDEVRRWIQVLTDTAENQQNNVIDGLYEVIDGEAVTLLLGPVVGDVFGGFALGTMGGIAGGAFAGAVAAAALGGFLDRHNLGVLTGTSGDADVE